jgi:Zn-dependent protease
MTTPQMLRRSRPLRQGVPLGTLAGIPLFVSPTWLIIAAILTIEYGRIADTWVAGLTGAPAYGVAALFAVLFAASILAHELGHAFVALALGRHVDSVVIYLLGGVSEIEESTRPRDEVLVAAAGPGVSIVLAGLGWAVSSAAEPHSVAWALAIWLTWGNGTVAIFNLLPGLPLDGGRVLRAGLWAATRSRYRSTTVAAWGGRVLAIALVAGQLALQRSWQGASLVSLPIALYLAFFLWVSAGQSLAQARRDERLSVITAGALARPVAIVGEAWTVQDAISRARTAGAQAIVVADAVGRPIGLLDDARVAAIAPEHWPWVLTAQAIMPLAPGASLPAALDGAQLIEAFRRHPAECTC